MAGKDYNKVKQLSCINGQSPITKVATKEVYNVSERERKKLRDHLCKSARRTKTATEREVNRFEYVAPILRPISAKDFGEFCNRDSSVQMAHVLEKKIRNKIQAKDLETRHPIVLAELIQESKEEYRKIVHNACMNLKIKSCYPDYAFKVKPFKYLGRTDRYQDYLLARKQFQLKWILYYPIVRRIIKESVLGLPNELCRLDFETTYSLNDLQDILKDKLRSATLTVQEFYYKILLLIDEDEKTKRRQKYANNYLSACTGIVSVHLSRAIAHTIQHVVDFTRSRDGKAYLNLEAALDKELVLQPASERVANTFLDFVDNLIDIGANMSVLENREHRSYKNRFMPQCLTQEFVSDCKQQIGLNIMKLYEPIDEHLNKLSADFCDVYSDINSEAFIDSISDIILESGCEKIICFKGYLNKAAYIPDKEYFKLGQISFTEYRKGLEEGLKTNIANIFEKLSLQHLYEITDLCDTFRLVEIRSKQKPSTTEELVEIGKFMAWIKNEHLEELTMRVEVSLAHLCRIIDLGMLSEEHISLNCEAVHWLDKSLPIIDNYFSKFEQLKYEAEEKLQAAVEDVTVSVKEVYAILVILDGMDDITRAGSYLKSITLHITKIKAIEEQISWINKEEVCLSFPKSTYSEFEDLKTYVYPFYHLQKTCLDVQRYLSVWQDGQFENLDFETTKNSVDKLYEELKKSYKTYREKLRRAQDENLPIRFKGTVDDPDILNWPAPLKLCGKAMQLIDDFKPSMDIMRIVCNKALRSRHWKAISEIAGTDITPNAGTTLRKMMKVDFKSHLNEYEIISTGAAKEKELIDNLRSLKKQWERIKFNVSLHKQAKMLTELEEIESIVIEHSIKVINMRGSVFVKPHEEEVKSFYNQITRIDETIKLWNTFQSQWFRLISIFSTGQLNNIIPKEAEIFNKVNNIYNGYIDLIVEVERVDNFVETPAILETINSCLTDLEIVRSGVITYLETVRMSFPRFYFLDDDELLDVVSRKDPFINQTFLVKIFQGLHNLDIGNSEIIGLESKQSEKIKFLDPVYLKNGEKVEELCRSIERRTKESIKYCIGECFKVYRRSDIKNILDKFPQQVLHVLSQVLWTENIETALKLTHNIKLRLYYQKLQENIEYNIKIMKENVGENLGKLKLKALIINDLNYRYLIDKILNSRILNPHEFDWESHQKYYIHKGLCTIQMMDIQQNYLYEYLGNFQPSVSTPPTDRCYITLINAYSLHFNGLVRGFAETGKSEIIRALAGALGVNLIQFCCLKKTNSTTMSRLLTGNSLCGSWICLENFNALEADVLSSVSQDMYSILSSKNGFDPCYIRGTSVAVSPTCFVTATINPKICQGILPENLKVLFRSITMMVPEVERIIEVELSSLGFKDVKRLAKKLHCLYRYAVDVLPPRSHYHFGITILKEIILECENLKANSSESDECLMLSAIKSLFSQFLIEEDLELFDDLVKEIFADAKATNEDVALKNLVSEYMSAKNFLWSEIFFNKVTQSYHCLKKSRGVILVGDTFSGKTSVINACEYLFTKIDSKKISRHTVNPTSLDYDTLYGRVTKASNVWSDGVVTKIIREFSLDGEARRKWIIFDGLINISLLENINSVLCDENKFHVESGEVIILENFQTVIFEVENLNSSSPSTVSRCKIIYLEPSTISYKSIVESWIKSCRSEWIQGHQNQIQDILNWLVHPCLNFISKQCRQLCDPHQINLVKSMLQITQIILDEAFKSIARKEEDARNLWAWIQAGLIQAGVMGLGSVLDVDSRHKFDGFYRTLWKGHNEDHPYPESFEKLEIGLPAEGFIFDYQFIYKQRGIWKLYQDLLKNEKICESPYVHELLIPTVDTLRYHFLLTMLVNNKLPTVLVGPSSTGKSLLIEDILINKMNKDQYDISHINCSKNTTAKQLQTYLLSKLNKKGTGLFTPSGNKNFLLFIDDLNQVKQSQTLNSLEFLRQHMDHNILYDFTNSDAIHLEKINFIAAMRPIEGSIKITNQRFFRHFNVFSINQFTEETITRIYSNVLFHVWKKGGFPSDITVIIGEIVAATLRIYQLILDRCKPTLYQGYYVFNLNNFTKVIYGCCRLRKETFDANKKIYLNLWPHEVLRVFGDRLASLDLDWLLECIKDIAKEEFNEEQDICTNLTSLVFGVFHDKGSRRYEEIMDDKSLVDILTECLKNYNYHNKEKMDLILFTYALEKLTKICRVISATPGNLLLLGSGGCGRQSLSKLAGYVYNLKFFQPKITTNYTIKEWNRDLKLVLKEAGALENECMLLVSEEQLLDEFFLQNIDHLLTNGEIPDFYDVDEKQEILELARLAAQGGNRNLDISSSDVFLFFNKRCKENLHLILCLDIKESLRRRLLNHPSFTNLNIILCENWPDESLQSISQNNMEKLDFEDETKEKISNVFIYFHRQSQALAKEVALISKLKVHITSNCFIHLIKLFIKIITSKRLEMDQKKNRYLQGLAKLSYAENQILHMKTALANYQPQLEELTKRASEMTEQIALESTEVEKASDLVRRDENIACEQASVAQVLKLECEAELAQAIPILEDAISALNTLKPTDITLVKSMKNPPDAIKLVMAAVCVIKDTKPDRLPDPSTGRKILDYWGPSKRILSDINFLQTLKDFDKDNIKAELMVKIRKEYLPHKDFKPSVVAKASSAAEGLCKWIIAMDMYDKVAKEVAPKKEKLEKAEKEYSETMRILTEKKGAVTRLEEKLANLNASLKDATKKQVKLQKEVDYCNKKLNSGQKLVDSLSCEKVRWMESVRDLETKQALLIGDILISCGIISHLSPFVDTDREKLIQTWHGYVRNISLACSEEFNMVNILATDIKFDSLRCGLLQDDFYIVNMVIKEFSQYQSLFIDPQYQASLWIQRLEKRNHLTVTSFSNDYLTEVKDCITSGKPILICKIKDYIPPCMSQLLKATSCIESDESVVAVGSELIKVNKNFRLYLVSNLDHPNFSSAVYENLTVINFSLTENGLEANLLVTVSEMEKPELKKLKKECNSQTRQNKIELLDVESRILNNLCESQTDVLEDEASIKILDESKELAEAVRRKQHEMETLQSSIKQSRNVYNSVARFGANLFICVNQLKKINVVYEFSLEWYLDLYFKTVMKARRSKNIDERIDNINECLTYEVFSNISYSLFQKDRLTFLFILTTSVMLFKGQLHYEDLLFFLKGNMTNRDYTIENPLSEWLNNEKWAELCTIECLPEFKGFLHHFTDNTSKWKTFFEDLEDIPSPWNHKLNSFNKLILLKILRKEHLLRNITNFIGTELGDKYIQTSRLDLAEIYNESYSLSPVLFFTSPGMNTLDAVKSMANKKRILNKFVWLPLATNETDTADNLIEEARNRGNFVVLQNCHLVPEWLQNLEEKINEMNFENTHEDFRLWMVSNVTENIPLELLQASIKVTREPIRVKGLKENMLELYQEEPMNDPSFFNGCPGKQKFFSRLLYCITFFHCLLENRKFGVYGWNVPYSTIDEEDLKVSLKLLQSIVNEDQFNIEELTKLSYIIGKCYYSKDLNDEWNIRQITVLLETYLNSTIIQSKNYLFDNLKPYGVPQKNDYKDHLNYISRLPDYDHPQLFGLNDVSIAFSTIKDSDLLITSSISVFEDSIEDNSDNSKSLIASIENMLSALPSELERFEENSFVRYENVKYNVLLDKIKESLEHLRRAFRGETTISCKEEELANRILSNSFPKIWRKYSYAHKFSLSRFIKDLCERVAFLKDFSKIPTKTLWLPAFFFPRAALSKSMLEYSIENTLALEDLAFDYEISSNGISPDEEGIYIYGFFSIGAKWDKENRTLVELSTTLYEEFPPILLKPVEKANVLSKGRYHCPIYQSESELDVDEFSPGSNNFIASILVPTQIDHKQWIRRGVKLVCQVYSEQ